MFSLHCNLSLWLYCHYLHYYDRRFCEPMYWHLVYISIAPFRGVPACCRDNLANGDSHEETFFGERGLRNALFDAVTTGHPRSDPR